MFSFGRSYGVLSTARALQGITSACFTIAGHPEKFYFSTSSTSLNSQHLLLFAGLGLVSSTYSEETKRSEALGRALGGGAVGVLLGYPVGGFLYQLTGKTFPFLLITTLAIPLLGTHFAI